MKYNIFKNKFKNCHQNTSKAKPDLVCAIKTRNKFICVRDHVLAPLRMPQITKQKFSPPLNFKLSF